MLMCGSGSDDDDDEELEQTRPHDPLLINSWFLIIKTFQCSHQQVSVVSEPV